MKQISRFKELVCVVFGHEWNSYGSTRDDKNFLLEEYTECSHCGLRNHDSSGYTKRFQMQLASSKGEKRQAAAMAAYKGKSLS